MNTYVQRRLQEISEGKGDWTGLQQPTETTVNKAREFTDIYFTPLIPTPSVVPTDTGSILFIWFENGLYKEIEIDEVEVEIRHDKPRQKPKKKSPLWDRMLHLTGHRR